MESFSSEHELYEQDGAPAIVPASLFVGQTFDNGTDALYAIQDYALKKGKSVRVGRSSGMDRRVVCTSSGCSFFVQVYRRRRANKTYGKWCVSSLEFEHTNCVSTAKPTKRQISQLPTFSSAVRASSQVSASTLISQIQERDSLSLVKHKRSVYRARESVNQQDSKAQSMSVGKLPSLLAEFAEQNPGSIAVAERDDTSRFKRAIVIAKVFVDATSARQRVVGIDCSHSKCPLYSGFQMHLVSRDSNMKNITIAFALVPAEDGESYAWFFRKVIQSGFVVSGIPMFCDRGTALLSVADNFSLNLKFCTLHILRNVVHQFASLTQQQKNIIWQLQASQTRDEYNMRLALIGVDLGNEVKLYLQAIDPGHWCVFPNIGVTPLYGWRTSNFVESVFGTQVVNGLRFLNPFGFMQAMCARLVDECYSRSQMVTAWETRGLIITPGAMSVYEKQSANIGMYAVQNASTDISYVHNQSQFPRVTRRVTLSTRHCTCAFMNQHGVPCRHLIASLNDRGVLANVFDYFDVCYRTASYSTAFKNKSILVPIDEELSHDPSWLPALVTKRMGRRKVRRIRSNGEEATGGLSAPYHCSRCGGASHNKRTCVLA